MRIFAAKLNSGIAYGNTLSYNRDKTISYGGKEA